MQTRLRRSGSQIRVSQCENRIAQSFQNTKDSVSSTPSRQTQKKKHQGTEGEAVTFSTGQLSPSGAQSPPDPSASKPQGGTESPWVRLWESEKGRHGFSARPTCIKTLPPVTRKHASPVRKQLPSLLRRPTAVPRGFVRPAPGFPSQARRNSSHPPPASDRGDRHPAAPAALTL